MEVMLINPAFKEGPRIDAWSGMALKINLVTSEILGASAQEVIECHLVESRGGSVGRNVAPQTAVSTVGVDHHGHGVPTCIALEASFHFPVAREGCLFLWRDGVNIRRADHSRSFHPFLAQSLCHIPPQTALQRWC